MAKNSLVILKYWSKDEFDDRQRKQDKLIQHQQHVKQDNPSSIDGKEIIRIKNKINSMLMNEEIYWKQRSRIDWLREGDKNTKFFRFKASAGRRKNKIWGIEDN